MKPHRNILSVVLFAVATGLGPAVFAQNMNEIIEESGAIFTYILDTQTDHTESITHQELAMKNGWRIVESDTTEHTFAGDAVLLNDSIALVFRRAGNGAELYGKFGDTYTLRARLLPAHADGSDAAFGKLSIVENSPGTVAVEATYGSGQDASTTIQFRIVTGQIYVEMLGRTNNARVSVLLDTEYLVVSDFFANDLVYKPKDFVGERDGIPAENFLIHLVSGGNALVTCVWKNREQRATAIVNPTASTIDGTEVQVDETVPAWVSVLEHPGVWYEQEISSTNDLEIGWTPPFPARWRADFLSFSESADSWNFVNERLPDYESLVAGLMVYPCWFDAEKAFLRVPPNLDPLPAKAVIYPIDRTQGTPLNVFCLVDIMRATLGFGACQYVLDLEGLDAQTSPTPALVMEWIEKQFKSGRDERSRAGITDRLGAMVEHVTHADARIAAYGEFAGELLKLLGDSKELGPTVGVADEVRKMREIASELEGTIGAYEALDDPVAASKEASTEVAAAIGQSDGLAHCERIASRLHLIGDVQDRMLSEGRMAARRIAQLAADMGNNEVATTIQGRCALILGETS